jgi:predicted metal-binding transcription factor (methanogenesis marker protein 9)
MEKKEIKKIMKEETCFGSISFCCDKDCEARNKCMKKLGLSKKDFYKLKKEFDESLYELLKGGKR